MRRWGRAIALACVSGVALLSSGCYEDNNLAPVVDGWYQPKAASNFYVVRSDDTIYSIAFAFGLDYRALVDANHLTPPYTLTPGQRLVMTHRPPSAAPVTTNSPQPLERVPASATIPSSPKEPVVSEPIEPLHPTASSSYSAPTPVERTVVEESPSVQKEPARQTVIEKPQPETRFSEHGGWRWPVKGRLLGHFSRAPDGHPGISIAGRLGESVRATASGTVVYSGDGVRGYGNLIIIKHNDSYLSAYAFNQRNLVSVGNRVRAGSVIARMGQNDAGRTLLYFEIRRNGVPVDPLRFLK